MRTDRHAQKLHKFFLPSSQPADCNSSPAVPQHVAGPRDGIDEAEPASSADGQDQQELPTELLPPTAEPAASVAVQGQQELLFTVQRKGKRPRLDSATAPNLASAQEKVQMGAHAGGLQISCSVFWQISC